MQFVRDVRYDLAIHHLMSTDMFCPSHQDLDDEISVRGPRTRGSLPANDSPALVKQWPEDVAEAAVLASDAAAWITGVALPIDGGGCIRT